MKLNELEDFPELGNTIVIDGNVYVKKQEPLSDKDIWTANTEQTFEEGVKWAENMHGITGGGE